MNEFDNKDDIHLIRLEKNNTKVKKKKKKSHLKESNITSNGKIKICHWSECAPECFGSSFIILFIYSIHFLLICYIFITKFIFNL